MKLKPLLQGMEGFFPSHFYSHFAEIFYAKNSKEGEDKWGALPSVAELLEEEGFARTSLFWNEEGLLGVVDVKSPLTDAQFPAYQKGDAIELFIDTRDNKKAKSPTRFCHHFLFLPLEADGVKNVELTKLRADDAHDIADPSLLTSTIEETREGYRLLFFIASEALHGYDPESFNKLGFAYAVHRAKRPSMNYPFSHAQFNPLQNPSLWASLTLKQENI